jgi:anaerobic ribonucleoside-triphosphate reductase activating protein
MEERTLRIAGIIRESIVDGPGIRFVVFAQGCPHRCPGCHNPGTHDFQGGYDCSLDKILKAAEENPLISGITFSGGEPFCQPEAFLELAKRIRQEKPELDILSFTGYTLEELQETAAINPSVGSLLTELDFLIDGPFLQEEKDLSLAFRGSRNQRFIDLKATMEKGEIILLS